MNYHKNIIRETDYPISFYLEDILYSLPINSESLALWVFLKRAFLCFFIYNSSVAYPHICSLVV